MLKESEAYMKEIFDILEHETSSQGENDYVNDLGDNSLVDAYREEIDNLKVSATNSKYS